MYLNLHRDVFLLVFHDLVSKNSERKIPILISPTLSDKKVDGTQRYIIIEKDTLTLLG